MIASDRLLRRTLWGNAVFSVISGAVLVAFAGPFATWATHEPVSLMGLDLARVIFAADIAWVAGSVLVLMLPAAWTGLGIAGIAVVALIVADIAILEYLG